MNLSFELSIIDKCSCCLFCDKFNQKKQHLYAFREASERLSEETDIVTLLKVLRVSKFMANTKLREE